MDTHTNEIWSMRHVTRWYIIHVKVVAHRRNKSLNTPREIRVVGSLKFGRRNDEGILIHGNKLFSNECVTKFSVLQNSIISIFPKISYWIFTTRCYHQQLSLAHLKDNFCNYKLKQFCTFPDSWMFSANALIVVKHNSQFLKVVGFLLLVFRCQLEYKVFLEVFSKLFLQFLLPLYWK
jgi:hypothetical protein